MRLANVLDGVAKRISDALGADVQVGDAAPVDDDGLPAVTLSAAEVTARLAGIGGIPRGTRTGALPVVVEVRLADPFVDLGGGQKLPLLYADRVTLALPHGPLVRADGVGERPFEAADLQVADNAPYTVVDTAPTGRQVRPDPVGATLVFGAPLPEAGTLTIRYHLGQWDVRVARYQGELGVAVAAATGAAVRTLSSQVADALAAPNPVTRLVPRSWGAVRAEKVGDGDAVGQLLGYRFDAEFEEPILPSGGGVISEIAVDLHNDNVVDTFTIAR